jgi:hypothetical protein
LMSSGAYIPTFISIVADHIPYWHEAALTWSIAYPTTF